MPQETPEDNSEEIVDNAQKESPKRIEDYEITTEQVQIGGDRKNMKTLEVQRLPGSTAIRIALTVREMNKGRCLSFDANTTPKWLKDGIQISEDSYQKLLDMRNEDESIKARAKNVIDKKTDGLRKKIFGGK
jgi:hypothetical protein